VQTSIALAPVFHIWKIASKS